VLQCARQLQRCASEAQRKSWLPCRSGRSKPAASLRKKLMRRSAQLRLSGSKPSANITKTFRRLRMRKSANYWPRRRRNFIALAARKINRNFAFLAESASDSSPYVTHGFGSKVLRTRAAPSPGQSREGNGSHFRPVSRSKVTLAL